MRKQMWSLAVVAALVGGAQTIAQDRPVKQVSANTAAAAATVNGQMITEAAVQRALKRIPPTEQAKARPEIVEFLIDNLLIEQYLVGQKVAVDPAEVAKRVQEIQAEVQKQKQDYAKMLKELSLTEDDLKQQIAADLRWEKFALGRANDTALKALFDQSTDIFDGTMVRARHVLISPPAGDAKAVEQAKATLAGIKGEVIAAGAAALKALPPTVDAATREQARMKAMDEAFAKAAEKHSVCPSKKEGGDISWFPRAGSMVEPFAKAAFSLKPFEISDPVATQFGYHLILATGRKPGQPVAFDKVKEDVRDVFCGRLRENLCTQLRSSAKINIAQAK